MHTTNHSNTFIEVADDCREQTGVVPPEKPEQTERTVARIHYDLISGDPYGRTSDDVVFTAFAEKRGVTADALEETRREFFSKGRPCLRSSPLAKRYGWGFHFDEASRVAIYGRDTPEYQKYCADPSLTHLKAMKSKR
jgi:hypothetical protein